MTDFLPPIGFWSYTSSDDSASRGRLSQLRTLLAEELQIKIGRMPRVQIFQDVATIRHGENWSGEIHRALSECSFFIPIITPAFLQSEWSCREVLRFQEREQALGRDDLIFPLLYVAIDPDRPGACHNPRVLEMLDTHQRIDFRALRIKDVHSEEVSALLDSISDSIRNAIYRKLPWRLAAPDAGASLVVTQIGRSLAASPNPDQPGPATSVDHVPKGQEVRKVQIDAASHPVALTAVAGLAAPAQLNPAPLVQPKARLSEHQYLAEPRQPASQPVSVPIDTDAAPVASRSARSASSSSSAFARSDSLTPAPRTVITDGPLLPVMVLIPSGRFTMGIPEAESLRERSTDGNARQLHEVTIPTAFYMGKYPVTGGEYAAFLADLGHKLTTFVRQAGGVHIGDNWPATGVCASDAEAYARWLSNKTGEIYRLPSEAEWEYAARAGTTTARFWGDRFEGFERHAAVDQVGT